MIYVFVFPTLTASPYLKDKQLQHRQPQTLSKLLAFVVSEAFCQGSPIQRKTQSSCPLEFSQDCSVQGSPLSLWLPNPRFFFPSQAESKKCILCRYLFLLKVTRKEKPARILSLPACLPAPTLGSQNEEIMKQNEILGIFLSWYTSSTSKFFFFCILHCP